MLQNLLKNMKFDLISDLIRRKKDKGNSTCVIDKQKPISISFSQIFFLFRYCVVFRVDKAMKACKHDMDTDDLHHGKSNFVKKLKK